MGHVVRGRRAGGRDGSFWLRRSSSKNFWHRDSFPLHWLAVMAAASDLVCRHRAGQRCSLWCAWCSGGGFQTETRCTRRDPARLQDGAQAPLTRIRHGVTETTTFWAEWSSAISVPLFVYFFSPHVALQRWMWSNRATETGLFSACLSSDRELIGAEGFWLFVLGSLRVLSEMRDLLLLTQPRPWSRLPTAEHSLARSLTRSLTRSHFSLCSKWHAQHWIPNSQVRKTINVKGTLKLILQNSFGFTDMEVQQNLAFSIFAWF